MTEQADVLIVGAGPTGLTLACALARAGTSVHLIDKITSRSPYSRALVLQLRSQEILNQLGIADGLAAKGARGTFGRIHVKRKLKAQVEFFDEDYAGCRFRTPLFVEQDLTEQALDDCLATLGRRAHFGHELAGFTESGDGVRATCRGPAGDSEVDARYLVGCDGAHSAVRDVKRIPFKGATYEQDFMLADVDIDWNQPRDAFLAFLDRTGFLVVLPMRDNTRLIAALGRYRESAPEPTLDDFRRLFERLVPYEAKLSNPVWIARFHLHHRIASRFRSGRTMLAGDAAHIHSPVGGQGMNTGIQDAWNLGWKLAWALRSPATADALLESYHEERYPVGKALLRTTDEAFNVVAGQAGFPRFVRTWIAPWAIPFAARLHGLQRLGMFRVAQLGINYRGSRLSGPDRDHKTFTRALKPGDRMPDFDIDGNSLHRLLDPVRPTVLAAGIEPGVSPRWHTIHLPKPAGQQRELLGLEARGCFLIRPDAHLAARAATVDGLSEASLARLWRQADNAGTAQEK